MKVVPNAARWTLPLLLAPPMITIGQYGVTLAEFIVVLTGGLILAFYDGPGRGTPFFMVVFLLTWVTGWIGSLFNSYDFHIPTGLGNAIFLYTPLLAWLAFLIGRYSAWQLNEIATSRVAFTIITLVGVFAVAYPFLSFSLRQLIMTPFINELFYSRLTSPRFPGMGVNANVYSFMVYVFLLFSLHSYLHGRGSPLIPLAALAIIIAAASRAIAVVSILTVLVLVGSASREAVRGAVDRIRAAVTRRRSVTIGLLIIALTVSAIIYGGQVREAFALYVRFQDMFSTSEVSGLKTRTDVWQIGLERVKLSPILGIPADPGRLDASNPLYFYTPHNEFLYFWTTFGVLGLFAFVYLIGRMTIANIRAHAGLPWLILYGAIFVQMMVDSFFGGPRTIVFSFMVIGLNAKYLSDLKARAPGRNARALEPVVA